MDAAANASPESHGSIRPLIGEDEIRTAVKRLGERITVDYTNKPLTILGVLTGSIMLVTDLIREIPLPLRLGLVQASSYRGTDTTPGSLTINTDLVPDIAGRDVLLVDDIFDTGYTMTALLERVAQFNPRSVQSAVLLWKPSRTVVETRPDYHCFEIPDEFVVGYGLDFNDDYRHLPYIGVLEETPT